jgi:ankyrin repeat protein
MDHLRFSRLGLVRIALENIGGVQRSIGPHRFTLEENKVQRDVEVILDVMAHCLAREYHMIVEELILFAKESDTTNAKSIYYEALDDINCVDKDKEQFSEVKSRLLQELLLIHKAEGNFPGVERTLKHMSILKYPTNSDSTGDVTANLADCFVIISTQIRDLLHGLQLPIRPPLHTDSGIHFPPLHRALRGDLDDVARLLGQTTAALNELDILRQNAVIAAAATGKAALLVPIFRNHPQLLTDRDVLERPALFHAAYHGDFESYLTLVNAGANIHHCDTSGQGILGAAAAAGSTKIVRDLLDRGVPPNDILYQSHPLHDAAQAGHQEVVRLLLDKGAWADYWVNSKTAAQLAAENGFQAISDMIAEATSQPKNNFNCWYPNLPANFQTAPSQRQAALGSRPTSSSNFISTLSPHPNTHGRPFVPSFASSQPSQHADQDYEVLNVSQNSTPCEPPYWAGVQVVSTTATTTEFVNDTYEIEEVL